MRIKAIWMVLCASAFLLAGATARSNAEGIGFAEAVGRMAISCKADIGKLCKNQSLGGGRVQQCLQRNATAVSPSCKTTVSDLSTLLQTRAQARAAVMRVCDIDIRRLCAGVQQGDGNLMECFYKARRNVGPQCQKVVADAGFDVALAPAAPTTQVALGAKSMLDSLQGVEAAAGNVNAASLRQLAVQGIHDPSRADRMNRAPLSEQLGQLAQFTIAIQFDFDSAQIRPDSFQAVGLMADALNHPYLQGYRFLIVGHTDAKGNREYNLKLSQQRADAIREALINPFGINASRIESVGLGEEQLLNRANPEAANNRRVQLVNIGAVR